MEDLTSTYSIGDFARLSGVTAKALRHYDRIGVLRPAVVHARSRYRRYSARQLTELYELLSLTRLGLSLREARAAIERRDTAGSLSRALLAAKREIETRVSEDQARLAWIASKLETLGGDVDLPHHPPTVSSAVVLKEQPPLRVMAVRDRLGTYADADELLDHIASDMATIGLSCLRGTVWHDCGAETGVIDCEAVVLSEARGRSRSPARSRVGQVQDLPAATLACVIHRGGDESVPSTYAAARKWIAAHGYTVIGPNREWYLGGASDEPVMEIQFPVGRARHQ
jgi:DNA-binding transcriptional MerR regulator